VANPALARLTRGRAPGQFTVARIGPCWIARNWFVHEMAGCELDEIAASCE
jgi:hypothetical protein